MVMPGGIRCQNEATYDNNKHGFWVKPALSGNLVLTLPQWSHYPMKDLGKLCMGRVFCEV